MKIVIDIDFDELIEVIKKEPQINEALGNKLNIFNDCTINNGTF